MREREIRHAVEQALIKRFCPKVKACVHAGTDPNAPPDAEFIVWIAIPTTLQPDTALAVYTQLLDSGLYWTANVQQATVESYHESYSGDQLDGYETSFDQPVGRHSSSTVEVKLYISDVPEDYDKVLNRRYAYW